MSQASQVNQEFFEALSLMEKEKGIPAEYLVEKIKTAISIAVRKDPQGSEENIVEIDPATQQFYGRGRGPQPGDQQGGRL